MEHTFKPVRGMTRGFVYAPVCANCGAAICGCTDSAWTGVVTIDRTSEPGSWARHLRDTACMRDHGPALPPSQARP